MSKPLIRITVLALSVALAACATTYKPRGVTGGYAEQHIDANTYTVSFFGNGYISSDRVDKYLLYRCAELTVAAGYDYFVIVEARTHDEPFVFGNKHVGTSTIKMFRGAKPVDNPNAWAAQGILQAPGPQITTQSPPGNHSQTADQHGDEAISPSTAAHRTPALAVDAWQRGRAAYDRQDYVAALHEWQFLARQGNAMAQYNLGGMYEQGLGVARDLAEAHRLYAKAAESLPPGSERDMAVQARARVERLRVTNQAPTPMPSSGTPSAPVSVSPSPASLPIPPPVSAPSRTMEAQKTTTTPLTQSRDGENISLTKKGGVYQLSVEINGVITLPFVLDTGAADVNIPADVVLTLYRAGTIRDADFLPGKTYVLADGSTVNRSRFLLRSLRVGSHHITNVPASIGALSSTLLLGQSFLERLGPWGLDSQRQVLTLGTQGPRKERTPRHTPSSPERGPYALLLFYPMGTSPREAPLL